MNYTVNAGASYSVPSSFSSSNSSGGESFASVFKRVKSSGDQKSVQQETRSQGSSDRQDARSQERATRLEARAQQRAERQEAGAQERTERAETRAQERAERTEARAQERTARSEARAEARAERQGGGAQPTTPAGPPTTNGQILGGTTVAGAVIDPISGDFTRNAGDVPIASVGVEDLGANADGTRDIRVTITNDGEEGGTFLTPPFVAIQDGKFDIYDRGGAAAEFLERLAEDGTTDDIIAAFEDSGAVGASGIITGPDGLAAGPLDPGESGSIVLTVDPTKSQFLNFASMVIPSNDAFISSPGDPTALQIFDADGNFTGGQFEVTGADVLDAGTEVNTEQDAAFLNQDGPNTGVTEGGVVTVHPGFIGSQGLPATDGPAQFPDHTISAKY